MFEPYFLSKDGFAKSVQVAIGKKGPKEKSKVRNH